MKTLSIFILNLLFITTINAQSQSPKLNQDPEKVKFVFSDIDNFWRAYDLAQKETAFDKKVEIYQREYYDKASDGLKNFIGLRIGKAENLVKKIDAMPKYYASIRANTLRAAEMRGQMLESFQRLKSIYPNAVFPDVYFVIGRLSSGGTTWSTGLLIGTEMCSLPKNADESEFTDWHKAVLKPIDELPGIVSHELIHFQQKMPDKAKLLTQSLNEGSADFVGEMISKMNINSKSYIYGNANEKALWLEFKAEMNGSNFDKWLYNGSKITDRPADLGYFVGYKICEAYYKKAKDKKQAIADILNIQDDEEFLKESGYARKFE
ncbi:MAG: hypothetical protein K1X72_26205 [Pyrinomonadaceae bacterium]|nr:hypothetical protein [Pyrinomonadaceae bacterium]